MIPKFLENYFDLQILSSFYNFLFYFKRLQRQADFQCKKGFWIFYSYVSFYTRLEILSKVKFRYLGQLWGEASGIKAKSGLSRILRKVLE